MTFPFTALLSYGDKNPCNTANCNRRVMKLVL